MKLSHLAVGVAALVGGRVLLFTMPVVLMMIGGIWRYLAALSNALAIAGASGERLILDEGCAAD